MSIKANSSPTSNYPQMPTWSRASQPINDINATIRNPHPNNQRRPGDDEDDVNADEQEQWSTARTAPLALENMFKQGGMELDTPATATPKVTARRAQGRGARAAEASEASEGVGTIGRKRSERRKSTLKGKPIRTSIFFDPLLPNPLVDPFPPSPSPPPYPDVPPQFQPRTDVDQIRSKELNPQKTVLKEEEIIKPESPTEHPDDQESEGDEDDNILDLAAAVPAVSLHSFEGETAFGELSFGAKEVLQIEVEDLGGGWSLGRSDDCGKYNQFLESPSNPTNPTVDSPPDEYKPSPSGLVENACPLSAEPSQTPNDPVVSHVPAKALLKSPTDAPKLTYAAVVMSSLPKEEPTVQPEEEVESAPVPLPAPPSSPPSPPSQPIQISTPSSPSTGPSTPAASTRPLPTPPHEVDTLETAAEADPGLVSTSPGSENSTASQIRSRSIGRNVVISGIEFEPADSLPSTPEDDHDDSLPLLRSGGTSVPNTSSFAPSIPKWLETNASSADLLLASTPNPTSEEMKEFFGELRSPTSLGGIEVERKEERDASEDTEKGVAPTGEGGDVKVKDEYLESRQEHSSEYGGVAGEVALGEQHNPPAETGGEDTEDDSQTAREARWASLVNEADREAMGFSPDPGDIGFQMDDDEALPPHPHFQPLETVEEYPDPDAVAPPESLVESPVMVQASTFSPSESQSPTGRPSLLDRIGLGTLTLATASTLSRSPSLTAGSKVFKGKNLVEDWILRGDGGNPRLDTGSAPDAIHIESGPAWKEDSPPFTVHVHSPEKRSSLNKSDFTVFQLTTVFPPSSTDSGSDDIDDPPVTVTVERRYSHFALLHSLIVELYPVLVIPALPTKAYAGRFQELFVETRRRDLERWLDRVGRHPVLRSSELVRGFLSIDKEKELQTILMPVKAQAVAPPLFFSRVYHPEFNVDAAEAEELVDRFDTHMKSHEVGGGVKEIDTAVGKAREGMRDLSLHFNKLAHHLARLAAGLALPPSSEADFELEGETDEDRQRRRAIAAGLQNEDGAITWKENCAESLSTTKAIQAVAEAIASVGEFYEESARASMLPVQEMLRELCHPHTQHQSLIQTHRQLLALYATLSQEPDQEEALARLDTLLNVTSSEFERVHGERLEDFRTAAAVLVDAEIALHEQALEKLQFSRSHFSPESFHSLALTGPRLRSRLERPPPTSAPPLPQPSTYGTPAGVGGIGVGSVLGGIRANGSTMRNVSGPSGVGSALGGFGAGWGTLKGTPTAATVGRNVGVEMVQPTWRGDQGDYGDLSGPSNSQLKTQTWRESLFGW
ncbi:hypothetical protein T439DRAFT_357117 [Meredithblackwellia eburnea MCA 4105]